MKRILFSAWLFLFCLMNVYAQQPTLKVGATMPAVKPNQVQNAGANAHGFIPSTAQAVGGDTLEYFFNKHYFRNLTTPTTAPANLQFYTLTNPYPSTTVTISHVGAVFLNSNSISITGLMGLAMVRPTSGHPSVNMRLYLCNVNGSNLPVFPPIDSILTSVTSSTAGNWYGTNFNTPHTVTGNFAVLYKNVSVFTNDTLGLFINNASTATSTVPANQKFGEGLGVMRYNGVFYVNTNIFGTGTDYEFIVAPKVSFNITAGDVCITPTICINSQGSFTNNTTTSSVPSTILENRQFNLNKFAPYWAPTNSLMPVTDSIYNWTFSGSTTTGTLFTKNASAVFNTNGIQTASMQVRYKYSGAGGSFFDMATTNINVSSAFAPTLTVNGGGTICTGSSTVLAVSGNPTYTWVSPPSNAATINVSPTSSTIYTVTGVNGGCVGYQTVQVNVVAPPSLTVTGPSSICSGKVFILTATGANSYTWNGTTNTPTISVSSTLAGTQGFTVQGMNVPCPLATAVKNVIINASPSVSVSATATSVCAKVTGGSTIALTGSPSGGVYSGTGVSGGVFTPSTVGNFVSTYSYTDNTTGCSSSATLALTVVNCTGIDKSIAGLLVSVYPNPVQEGKLHVSNLSGKNSIEVYNIIGEKVFRAETDKEEFILSTENWNRGTYFLRIIDENKSVKIVRIVNP